MPKDVHNMHQDIHWTIAFIVNVWNLNRRVVNKLCFSHTIKYYALLKRIRQVGTKVVFFKNLFILFLAALGLRCCTRAFL